MNRIEFMRELEALLKDIPDAEREEALQYYNDYFDDAGTENEQEVLSALGTPEKIAETIRKDLRGEEASLRMKAAPGDHVVVKYGTTMDESTFTEQETGDACQQRETDNRQNTRYSTASSVEERRKPTPGWASALIVILAVLAAPIWIPLGLGVFAALFGLLAAWFGFALAMGVVAVALLIVFITLIIVGFMCISVNPLVFAALIGGGMVCGAIGILFLMLTVCLAGVVTPAIFRGIGSLFGGRRERRR